MQQGQQALWLQLEDMRGASNSWLFTTVRSPPNCYVWKEHSPCLSLRTAMIACFGSLRVAQPSSEALPVGLGTPQCVSLSLANWRTPWQSCHCQSYYNQQVSSVLDNNNKSGSAKTTVIQPRRMGLDALLSESDVGLDYISFQEKISALKLADSHEETFVSSLIK